jgi:hypothetical protein
VNLAIRRITIAVLAAALAGAVLAVPASSNSGPAAIAKKKAKKCKKKGKKGKKAKKRKGCKHGSSSVSGLPGEATPASPKQPNTPPPPPDNPDLHVSSVSVTDHTLLGGNSTSGLVTLDHVATAGGQQVDLTSDVAPRVQVPASVVVVEGQKTASFQVDTTFGTPITGTLTASVGTTNATTTLKVVDRPSVASVKLQRRCFTPGTWPTNRVTLDIPAPGDVSVALESSDPLSLALPLATVTVPSGSTSALFAVNALAASDGVSVSGTAPSTPPQSDSATVSLTDPATEVDGLTLVPDTVRPGGGSTGTVTLTCEAPPGGTEVTVSAEDGSGITVPDTVTVPAGELSVDFQINVDPATEDDTYEISATAGGGDVHAPLKVSSVLAT